MIRRFASLRLVLPALTALLVLGVVALVSSFAVDLLRRLGDDQALARVRSAGSAATREIAQTGEKVAVGVRLLVERPTLGRYAAAGDVEAQRGFLRQFAATSGMDGCATFAGDVAIAAGDREIPWSDLAPLDAPPADEWYVRAGPRGCGPLLVATSTRSVPPLRVACARWLGDTIAAEVAGQVGVPVTILDLATLDRDAGRVLSTLRHGVAGDGVAATARVGSAFVDLEPLRDRAGEIVALVETRLATASVDGSVARLRRTLRLGSAGAAALAALAALWVARKLTHPLAGLARAAQRIGAGDLDSPVPVASGSEIGVLAETMEETRTRLLELTSELRRRHSELAAILDGIVEGVWAVDRERRITWMNPQAAERLGTRVEDAVGRFCGDVLNPVLPGGGRPCESDCPILDARFRGGARATEQLRVADGTTRTVVITSAPTVADGDDRQFQVLRDETDVEAVRRMRDSVLANVSHEFRTPLSAQLASLEMLRERVAAGGDPAVAQLVRSMERGTARLVRLVDNLLESLRIDAGRDSIRRRPLDLGAAIDEALEQAAPLVEQKGQTLDVRVPRPLPSLTGDAQRLVQVFTNLLANANKFAPAGSTITVGGAVEGNEVRISIEDRGPGFPDDMEERPFERFVRAAGEEPEERGIGLGLWISSSIVRRHGGRLVARNTGTGAWVAVILPLARGDSDEDPGR